MINEITRSMKSAEMYNKLKEVFHYYPTKERYDYLIQSKEEADSILSSTENKEIESVLKTKVEKIKHELSFYQKKVIEETENGFFTSYRLMTEDEMENYEDYLSELIQWQYKMHEKTFKKKEINWLEERWRDNAMEVVYMAEELLYNRKSIEK